MNLPLKNLQWSKKIKVKINEKMNKIFTIHFTYIANLIYKS